jgi:hypothetical protein
MVIFTASMVVVPWIRNHALRLRYILTSLLTWFVGGNILALLFSSSGPCFVGPLYGDGTYAPLMTLLRDVDADTGMVWALIGQNILWEAYTRDVGAISGISAMPSLHVAVAVIIACMTWQRGGVWRGSAWPMPSPSTSARSNSAGITRPMESLAAAWRSCSGKRLRI